VSIDAALPLALTLSFAAGLNAYATVAVLGATARAGLIALPPQLALVDDWWVIGACAALFALEFVMDKIPLVDLVWNALQTFVRVPVGALLAYAYAGAGMEDVGWQQIAAGGAGGTAAFAAHVAKTAARAAVTPYPEPFTNTALSLAEDAFTIFIVWFATEYPYLAAAIVVILLVIIAVMIRALWRVLKSLRQRWRARSAITRPTAPA
jgi:hypothetical protein